MKRFFAGLISILAIAQLGHAQEPIREPIEWLDIWVTDADKNDLPRVLLVGDSITKGYFRKVEKRLAGKAYCARLTTSKCVADPSLLDEVQLVLKQYRFAVIHFNNGLHGAGYTKDQYRSGLLRLMDAFKKHAAGAELIWATTTPIRKRDNLQQIDKRTKMAIARNQVAADIMNQRGVPTDDLYGLVEAHPEFSADDGIHYNGKGRAAQGEQVAKSVSRRLSLETNLPDGLGCTGSLPCHRCLSRAKVTRKAGSRLRLLVLLTKVAVDLKHVVVVFQRHPGKDGVRRAVDVAAARRGMFEAIQRRAANGLQGTILQQVALHVAHQGHPPVAPPLHLGDVHAGHGIHRLQTCRPNSKVLIEDGHDVAVSMHEGDRPPSLDVLHLTRQIGRDDFMEVLGGNERTAIVRHVVRQINKIRSGIDQLIDLRDRSTGLLFSYHMDVLRPLDQVDGELAPVGHVFD